jgi:hypothetical protein
MVGEHFEALLTVDDDLPFQQKLRRVGVGVVLAYARSNRVQELRPLIPPILEALQPLLAGELIEVGV